jgi:hypothetical protein
MTSNESYSCKVIELEGTGTARGLPAMRDTEDTPPSVHGSVMKDMTSNSIKE